MMDDNELINFFKENSNFFKQYKINIPLFEKDYGFDIVIVTSEYVKLKCNLKFYDIFSSKEDSVEYLIKNIIDDGGRHVIPDSESLAQRARLRRGIKGVSLPVMVGDYVEEFIIKNITQEFISIEYVINFDSLNISEGNDIYSIFKQQLFYLKDDVDDNVKFKQEEELNKEKSRKKRVIYSKDEFIEHSLKYKPYLKREEFPINIYGVVYSFDIEGIGEYAIKIGKYFTMEEIFNSKPLSVENNVKKLILNVLKEQFDDFNEFVNKLKINEDKLDYQSISILVGNELFEFTLFIYPGFVKLVQFIRYENIMGKFNENKYSMETILKRHVETFKPKLSEYDYSREIDLLGSRKRRYKRPPLSEKEDIETIKKKLSQKQEFLKNYRENRSYMSNNRSNEMNKILR